MKRIFAILVLWIACSTGTAFGFSDVSESAWYYQDVETLKNSGIITGYEDGTFRPDNNVTYAEAYKTIFEISDVYVRDRESGEFWAQNMVDRAELYGFADEPNFDANQSITRAEVADLIATVYGLEDSTMKTNDEGDVITSAFIDSKDPEENLLYRTGIIKGTEANGKRYFYPEKKITRAEIGAILLRIRAFREDLAIDGAAIFDNALAAQDSDQLAEFDALNETPSLPEVPSGEEDYRDVLLYMAKENVFRLSFHYPGVSFDSFKSSGWADDLKAAQEYVFSYYPEYLSTRNSMAYSLSGTSKSCDLTVELGSQYFSNAEAREMQLIFFEQARQTALTMINDQTITEQMTDREIAKELFRYIVQSTQYDDSFADVSYTGYGQMLYGEAVCQGYSASYVLLCKLFGINMHGITGNTGEEHMWTLANFDGSWVHIDPTWGDSYDSKQVNYDYFAADSDFMKKTHTWDESMFGE